MEISLSVVSERSLEEVSEMSVYKKGFSRFQHGITLIGFIIVLSVVGFFAYLGMKIGPAYLEFYNVWTAMEGVSKEPGVSGWSTAQVKTALNKRLFINYVNEQHVNMKHFEVKRVGGSQTLRVFYEVREELIYNLDYVATFEKTVNLTRSGEPSA
jgi:Domain of unknown function (DUF4845)